MPEQPTSDRKAVKANTSRGGQLLYDRKSSSDDIGKGISLYEAAAAAKDHKAEYYLAYYYGNGKKRDYKQSSRRNTIGEQAVGGCFCWPVSAAWRLRFFCTAFFPL